MIGYLEKEVTGSSRLKGPSIAHRPVGSNSIYDHFFLFVFILHVVNIVPINVEIEIAELQNCN